MIFKICGNKNIDNIREMNQLAVHFLGFIFHEASPRNICSPSQSFNFVSKLKIGVFVNKPFDFINSKINEYKLNGVQLHGNETPDLCQRLKVNTRVFKAFGIDHNFDFKQLDDYIDHVHYFLFDTKTPNHGGSGIKFNWSILENYNLDIPYFLSGGISIDDIETLKSLNHQQLIGLDLNSRFESEPGIKNKEILTTFLNQFNE